MVEVGTRGLGEQLAICVVSPRLLVSLSPRQNLSVAFFFRFHVITVPIVKKAIELTCPN